MPYRVFVSHSVRPDDVSVLSRISEVVTPLGIECYFAQHDAQPGQFLDAKLQRAIAGSDAVLVLLTRNSVQSDWVKWEVGAARASNKPIIPVVENRVVIPDFLAGREFIGFDRANPEATVQAVANYLNTQKVAQDNQKAILLLSVTAIGLIALLSRAK